VSPPRTVQVCLVLQRAFLGSDFLLLTPSNLISHIDCLHEEKCWNFGVPGLDDASKARQEIVAFSDFIRMRYVFLHGGFWIDADALPISSPRKLLSLIDDRDCAWGYEVFFGAKPGLAALHKASQKMLEMPCQLWGNPGCIKDEIESTSADGYRSYSQ